MHFQSHVLDKKMKFLNIITKIKKETGTISLTYACRKKYNFIYNDR